MVLKKSILIIPILSLISIINCAHRKDEIALRKIAILEDARTIAGDQLSAFLKHPDAVVRQRAALAAGRVGDPAIIPPLAELLRDAEPSVRLETAFALGQLKDSSAAPHLINFFEAGDAEEKTLALEALGKIAGETAKSFLRLKLAQSPQNLLPSVILALTFAKDEASLAQICTYLDHPQIELRRSAAYSAYRIATAEVELPLIKALSDSDATIRKYCAGALGRIALPRLALYLRPLLYDADQSVVIQTIRALGKCQSQIIAGDLLKLANSDNYQLYREAIEALGSLKASSVADSLEKMIKTDSGNKIPFLIKALTQIEGIRFLPFLETYSDHPEGRVRRATAESLTFIRGAKALSLARDLLSDPDPTVRTATITSLAQHGSPAGEFLTSSLNDSDWAVRTSAIEGIKVLNRASQFQNLENAFKSKFDRTEAEESNALLTAMFALDEEKTIPYLFSALNSVHYPLRASARELLHQAGQTLPPDPTPDFNSYPPDFGKSLGPQFICIITAKGRIEVELFGDDAPLVAGNMLKLIRQGFYKDLVLHRVVPDFVIQSGDPRGDGWGGPGFSIRDQVNRRKFLTGTMGLPISQKDTGGSQFFICLSPQPHLDGNYTAFGQVVKGIEILSDLSEGDSILEINLSLKDNTKPKYRQL